MDIDFDTFYVHILLLKCLLIILTHNLELTLNYRTSSSLPDQQAGFSSRTNYFSSIIFLT